MATASIPGFKASLYVQSSSDAAPNRLGELASCTLTIASAAMDATSKDSGGWREYLDGLNEWSLTGEGLYLLESSNAGQLSLWNTIVAQGKVTAILYPGSTLVVVGSSGWQKYSGTAVVTGFDIDAPVDGAVKYKVSLKGTGAITRAAATS